MAPLRCGRHMNTENQVPTTPPCASHDQVFSFAARVATKVNSWKLKPEVIQAAIDRPDDDPHSVWEALRNALDPKQELDTTGVVPDIVVPGVFVPRIEVLSERPKPCVNRSDDEQVEDLKRIYAKLRWTWTDSGLVIPKPQNGFDRILAFADTGLTNNQLLGVCKNSFPSWSYNTDLNSAIPANNDQRHPSRGPYIIRVRDQVGPDPKLMGLSANQIVEQGLNTMTLMERMYFELVHFWETGEHLDPRTLTLCAGSRASDGDVPYADWNDGKFKVYWCKPDCRDPSIGARQAVTL